MSSLKRWLSGPAAGERAVFAVGLGLLALTLSIDLENLRAGSGAGFVFWTFVLGALLVVVGSVATGWRLAEEVPSDLPLRSVAFSGAFALAVVGFRVGTYWGDVGDFFLLIAGVGSAFLAYGLLFFFAHGVHAGLWPERTRVLLWAALGLAVVGFLWPDRRFTAVIGVGWPLALIGLAVAPISGVNEILDRFER